MTTALVVGEPRSGQTTFVGLLYTAVVRFGTEEGDRFRFHADRESIRRLEAIYGALGDGRFPEVDLDPDAGPLRFVFGFRRSGLGGWARGGSDEDGDFLTVPVQVGGFPTAEVAELGERLPVLDEATRHLLRSPILVALVNAAALLVPPAADASGPAARRDHELARAMETVVRFLALERRRKERTLYPIFVLTQFDRAPEATLHALAAPAGPPSSWSLADRGAFGLRVLETFLPETARFLGTAGGTRVTVAPAAWFFSGIATEDRGPDGIRVRRRSRLPEAGWEPEYPYEEYRGLLLELGYRARPGRLVASA